MSRKLQRPRNPVAVNRSELESLWRAWRHFLDTDMQIDPLAEAIHRLKQRLDESRVPEKPQRVQEQCNRFRHDEHCAHLHES